MKQNRRLEKKRVVRRLVDKKGFLFSLDAFLAATLLIGGLILITQQFSDAAPQEQIAFLSQDTLRAVSTIKIKELQDPTIQALIADGTIDDPDVSVLLQIGKFWALDDTVNAENLTTLLIANLLPAGYSLALEIEDDNLYNNSGADYRAVAAARRMITGVTKGEALEGSSGVAYLQHITNKRMSEYVYFGGFVGQGNISALLSLPPDTNGSSITEVVLEADIDEDFSFFINDDPCGDYNSSSLGNFSPDVWNLTSCKNSLQGGDNLIEIRFSNVNNAFIGGGFLRVTYTTDEFQQSGTLGSDLKKLPGIEGIVNLYDSFDVRGDLQELAVHLHYFADHSGAQNYTFYLTIGNETILADANSTTDQDIYIPNSSFAGVNFSRWSDTTIPLRIGFQNLTYSSEFFGAADVIIVTDTSGSMDWQMGGTSTGTARNCDSSLLNASTTARLSVAKCLDKQFALDILSILGNFLGLVSYDSSTNGGETVSPTDDAALINATIGNASPETGYAGGGSTCICCGINSALTALTNGVSRTVVISQNSQWMYTTDYFFSEPPDDASNYSWYERAYDDSSWTTAGAAIYGTKNDMTYDPDVDTDIGSDIANPPSYADLWEHAADDDGAPLDFNGGLLNTTANTWGRGAGDDGWDWEPEDGSGEFGFDDDVVFVGITNGKLHIDGRTGAGNDNDCTNNDCSGAYGLEVTITPAQYAIISGGGTASISFQQEWAGAGGANPFGTGDEVWTKASWESPTTGVHWLGAESSSSCGDTTPETRRMNNPDNEYDELYTQDITSWIEGAGTYYLAIGGKLCADRDQEWGEWYFDDIQLVFDPLPAVLYVDMWEHSNDISGPPADFDGGTLNTSGTDYGLGGADDGWDEDPEDNSGPFGNDDAMDYTPINGVGQLEMENNRGGDNDCYGEDCSGAFGIELVITNDMWTVLQNNGTAFLTFYYAWDDRDGNEFESSDQVWVKARWTTPTTSYMLGDDLDAGQDGADTDVEIASRDNPDVDFSGWYNEDISALIEGPGNYYLEIGGKLKANSNNEYGTWRFDDVQLAVTDKENNYYFRKDFTIASLPSVGRAFINVLEDDIVDVYVNGNKIDVETTGDVAEYWNGRGIDVPVTYLLSGNNVVAAHLRNLQGAAKFDLELVTLNTTRQMAMMVMSDGQANVQCGAQSTGDAGLDAVLAACQAKENWGATVYAVGYSDDADDATLSAIAACGMGRHVTSADSEELQDFYTDVAYSIIAAAVQSQTVVVQGAYESSVLYNDSYINITYTPITFDPQPGEIELVFQSPQFGGCTGTVDIPSGVRLVEAVVTSYSGDHWTDLVSVGGTTVFNLSRYNYYYSALGDPYRVGIPVDTLVSGGTNTITMRTGDNATYPTGCSDNNSLIYRGYVNSTTSRSKVLEFSEGCSWTVEFEDGSFGNFSIPFDYAGGRTCAYTNANISYATTDSYDVATFVLFDKLDFDNDGRVFINLQGSDLKVIVSLVSQVPYLWGPSVVRLVVSR